MTNGRNGAQWGNVAPEGDEDAAQVLDYIGLNGGPWAIQTVPPTLVRIRLKLFPILARYDDVLRLL